MHVCSERAEMLAARVEQLATLRRSERAERKIAIVLFNFPPNAGNTGTAAYLSVFESLHHTLRGMKRRGLSASTCPRASTRCANDSRRQRRPLRRRWPTSTSRIAADDHVRRETLAGADRGAMGTGAGRQQSDGASILVLGERFGNVFVGIQPAFGYEGDPMRLLFEQGFAPTHAFSAFYRWIARGFRRRTRCCISAPMARWNSCRASRRACPARAGPTG